MNILLTNDDGYTSEGLRLLCSELAKSGHNVYIVAPDGQRSGFSHAMHYNTDITLTQLDDFFGAKRAFCCSGTPADCVRIGRLHLGVKFDLLVAGPNNGANFGRAVLCSGTVGAAEEGTLCGIPSIALSRLPRDGSFEPAVKYLIDNLDSLTHAIGSDFLLNINVPDTEPNGIVGVKVCPQSTSLPSFADGCEVVDENTVRIVGKRNPLTNEESDVVYCCNGYITITPMTVAQTASEKLIALARLEK